VTPIVWWPLVVFAAAAVTITALIVRIAYAITPRRNPAARTPPGGCPTCSAGPAIWCRIGCDNTEPRNQP
jgi:hypothetical protein